MHNKFQAREFPSEILPTQVCHQVWYKVMSASLQDITFEQFRFELNNFMFDKTLFLQQIVL